MPRDNNAILQASVTKTASFNGAGLDLGAGTPRSGMKASVQVTGFAGSDTTVSFKIQHGTDDVSFTDLAFAETAVMTGIGETFISFDTDKRYVRLVATIAGTAPSVTYASTIVAGRP